MTEHFPSFVHGDGPGLVLAHGAGGDIPANFGAIAGALAATHTVVGTDYPGSGDSPSSRGGPPRLDELADTLVRTALAAGLPRFTVLGYSLGAAVAVRAATRHPEAVDGLILTAGFASADNRIRLAAEVWRGLLAHGDRVLLARYLTLLGTGGPWLHALSASEIEESVAALAAFIPPGSADQVELVSDVDVRAELAGIAVPTLVVATTEDGLVGRERSSELAERIPGAELREIPAGHGIGTEAPGEWLAVIRDFLDRRA
ncbi:alpha/beta hydrolase [Amycolatopsis antarctica]|uniref:Alpha/beta hydrolase n=1 Tax=Amycolatopsis antarctica TaxID=1854586 RepID=A0A263D8W0_9PSEU|nr:alpha/beta hydrolase [Amycolatopsis antarctica]OZM73825.1 alpha/beta hydrolase [Amycolatopsis antarctica]